jgi:hypothetical protein
MKKSKKEIKSNTFNLKKIKDYLNNLYQDKRHWAFCHIQTEFTAGNIIKFQISYNS